MQAPLILLAKCFVDAIDPVPLKAYLGDAESGERSLSLLGRLLSASADLKMTSKG